MLLCDGCLAIFENYDGDDDDEESTNQHHHHHHHHHYFYHQHSKRNAIGTYVNFKLDASVFRISIHIPYQTILPSTTLRSWKTGH